jgi:transmembrane sensor
MNQRTVIELLALKLSGDATPEDLLELEELIAKNPDSVYYQEIFGQLFQNTEDKSDIEYYYNRHRLKYQDKLIFARETVSSINRFRLSRSLLAACLTLLVLSATVLFFYNYKKQASLTSYNTQIVSGSTVRKNMVLPDGTRVWLNAGSTLLYDKDINKRDFRAVKLTGEAFFEVAHNKARPFIINTDKISIKVLGTAFNVKAYPSDKTTETTLLRGSIELSVHLMNARKLMLKPQEKFALTDNRSKAEQAAGTNSDHALTMTVEKISPVRVAGKRYTEEVSWMDNRLVFKNESFEKLIPRLERWYGIKLEVKREEIMDYHFTGVFTSEDLTQALTAMKLIKHFNFKIEGHDVIIY